MDEKLFATIRALKAALLQESADVSDIDGTVYKWQLLIMLVLGITDAFPKKKSLVKPLKHAIDDYRARRGEFGEVIRLLLLVIPEVFIGVPRSRVKNLAKVIAESEAPQVYTFPKKLYQILKSQKRILIAITGAPQEVAEPFCAKLGFDFVIGADYKVNSKGMYTGEYDISSGIAKGLIMDTLANECGLKWDKSIGLGDSEADIPIFDRVGWPIAVNPNTSLIAHIRSHTEKPIAFVRDGQKSGVQIFLPTEQGYFIETRSIHILPIGVAEKLGEIPGICSSL